MLNILHDEYLLPPDPRPYNISSNNAWYIDDNKLYGKDIRNQLKDIFFHEHNGFFVEAGALDGVYLSNTLWLEKERGWTGLLIGPNIFSYRELLTKHRKAWVSNTCISSTLHPRQTVMVSLIPGGRTSHSEMNVRGSSYEFGVNLDISEDEPYYRDIHFLLNSATKHLTNVQCFPLKSYLLALNVSTVDLLSLDIQGSEMAVLDTLPWESVNFRALVVEYISQVMDQNFLDIMTTRGYNYQHLTEDILFIKKGDPLLDLKFEVHADTVVYT
ncbi:unnamed protein product [Meganyctiphanes norvegica]|uniref:Methyltransferase FkbM domain-containing protein n=1 Tax=Meganyctiphanes norvegica TaxID=48144 RepID=A0AAV2S5I7_MEGNR